MGLTSDYRAPKATIDPDKSKTWLKRAWPIVMAHKGVFFTSLILSFVGLVIQVQIPKTAAERHRQLAAGRKLHHIRCRCTSTSTWVVVLGLVGGVAGYISRIALFHVAYDIEFDLRNILYEHLTRMSFPFYDRVQSGQLISRANSDIRSVQMYLTFAPMILVQCSIALVAFGYMLSINVPLALVAMITMPFIYWVGVKMRKSLFPVSWIIQSRLAEVATVVDENVNGVRVVRILRCRGAAAAPAGHCGRPGAVGLRQGCRPPRPLHAPGAEPLPGRPGRWSFSSAGTWSSTGTCNWAPSSPSTCTCS